MTVTCADYMKTWVYAEAIRRRLQNETCGVFRLNTSEGGITLEIGDKVQAVAPIGRDASADVFRCYLAYRVLTDQGQEA